ncbi:MAG: FAD-dependent oxidoreductase [Candidatus Paracaedimonas acanthamoebae]|uniref:FAD-dependent oxidoreductase n=1 Tax=Candidatus Paracaedimonas acanthamoebae TaxID=244581 RepID=A0A8J7PLE6_9PROT|nr:FAD-dependent oxidoreductase [Candidatus Paracaedimonas acanthamoebae]
MKKFSLKNGVSFEDLKTIEGLKKVEASFIHFLTQQDALLSAEYQQARLRPEALTIKEESFLLLKVACFLEDYLAALFGIEDEIEALREQHALLGPLWQCKKQFILRRVSLQKKRTAEQASSPPLLKEFQSNEDLVTQELHFAHQILKWLDNESLNSENLDQARHYAEWALTHPEGQKKHQKGLLFKLPAPWDFSRLITVVEEDNGLTLERDQRRERKGFDLTDAGVFREHALDQATYCIKCHPQGKDSCAKGLYEKGSSHLQINPLDNKLAGCPLQQKISEMNDLKAKGLSLAAFAIILVDNPLVAATGHRICNDCAKACIFQKQTPVDVPSIETQILDEILSLPWGFEIYALLVQWNPLNLKKPFPEAPTGRNALVVGMGPAGFTAAHYLLREGHTVVGIDGLKIEPLPSVYHEPIYEIKAHFDDLDRRLIAGFGGVAEYGITVRWQKNYLLLIRILLERQAHFRLFGGVRLGSQITIETSWELGFHHIALCCGAGSPRWLPLKNSMVPGVRLAQDFLMALQLMGASRETTLSSLTIRLPIVVIGGGLTAIDAATEALAYYPLQVEKFAKRYRALVEKLGEKKVTAGWSEEDHAIAQEFLSHADLFAHSKEKLPDILEKLGGATLLYRKDLTEAPSYRGNHEEVFKALQEGVKFLPDASLLEILTDEKGQANGVKIRRGSIDENRPARTILIAAGTTPNTQVAEEFPDIFKIEDGYLKSLSEDSCMAAKDAQGRTISFFGDLDARYAGSVVKAMASAKHGVPLITGALKQLSLEPENPSSLIQRVEKAFTSTLQSVKRLTEQAIELIIHSPAAARHFQPGQIFRLQNYETNAPRHKGYPLLMEGIAVRGAWVDKEQGLIGVVVFEIGASSLVSQYLQPHDPILLMGPTGSPTEIPQGEKVLLIGEGHGNAGLVEIARAMKAAGNEVHYVVGYEQPTDVIYQEERVEQAADYLYWAFSQTPEAWSLRPQDQLFQRTVVEALEALVQTQKIREIDRLFIMASATTMAAIDQMKASFVKTKCQAIASVNAPMQCMMKGVCGQCLQRHRDPLTGQESMVLSCRTQDQPLEKVDYASLSGRLRQNRVQEKVNALWLRQLFKNSTFEMR